MILRYNEKEDLDKNYDIAVTKRGSKFDNFLEEFDKDTYFNSEGALGEIKPYIQISKNGLFLNTVNLFELKKEIKDYEKGKDDSCLSNERSFIIALYYFYKLNGVLSITNERINPKEEELEVKKWRINFYNGDYYQFENDERSFLKSLGNYFRYEGLSSKKADPSKGLVYWDRFFSEVSLCRIRRDSLYCANDGDSAGVINREAVDTGKLSYIIFDAGEGEFLE